MQPQFVLIYGKTESFDSYQALDGNVLVGGVITIQGSGHGTSLLPLVLRYVLGVSYFMEYDQFLTFSNNILRFVY